VLLNTDADRIVSHSPLKLHSTFH